MLEDQIKLLNDLKDYIKQHRVMDVRNLRYIVSGSVPYMIIHFNNPIELENYIESTFNIAGYTVKTSFDCMLIQTILAIVKTKPFNQYSAEMFRILSKKVFPEKIISTNRYKEEYAEILMEAIDTNLPSSEILTILRLTME